ncbi:MAG: hypothetical protein US52_C0058G0004 [candidate division WS6 bacterium GW2011_GWA2_37_6]|uniref:Uncharacterized protein n=1 Tax=candidate division WS6 bacterium GW2011_GWA2_37_6 TaxID=1619087 RepID=A0A0G0GWK8_9BACT|nr:MAG: hypothetical protein US52_C0058G0004 [candidate division WS6 bacterium GW2011_GWA2_37_6]
MALNESSLRLHVPISLTRDAGSRNLEPVITGNLSVDLVNYRDRLKELFISTPAWLIDLFTLGEELLLMKKYQVGVVVVESESQPWYRRNGTNRVEFNKECRDRIDAVLAIARAGFGKECSPEYTYLTSSGFKGGWAQDPLQNLGGSRSDLSPIALSAIGHILHLPRIISANDGYYRTNIERNNNTLRPFLIDRGFFTEEELTYISMNLDNIFNRRNSN